MPTLQELLAAKAQKNLESAKAAQTPVNTAAGNIQTGMAAASYGRLRSEAPNLTKELDLSRAQAALAVFEDIKLRLIPRGRGKPFRSENGYFYVENEVDAGIISGYVGKSIPVIKQITSEELAELAAQLGQGNKED